MWFRVLHVILRLIVPSIIIPTFIPGGCWVIPFLPSFIGFSIVAPSGLLVGVLVPAIVVLLVLGGIEDLDGVIVAFGAEAKCQRTSF